jgi:hypothetical protein
MAHYETCQVTRCPERTVARISDEGNQKRWDLCFRHTIAALRDYPDQVIRETWNGTTEAQIRLAVNQLLEMRK